MGKQNTPTNAQLRESLIERIDKHCIANGRKPGKEGHATGHFVRILPKRKQPSNEQGNKPSEDNNNNQ